MLAHLQLCKISSVQGLRNPVRVIRLTLSPAAHAAQIAAERWRRDAIAGGRGIAMLDVSAAGDGQRFYRGDAHCLALLGAFTAAVFCAFYCVNGKRRPALRSRRSQLLPYYLRPAATRALLRRATTSPSAALRWR